MRLDPPPPSDPALAAPLAAASAARYGRERAAVERDLAAALARIELTHRPPVASRRGQAVGGVPRDAAIGTTSGGQGKRRNQNRPRRESHAAPHQGTLFDATTLPSTSDAASLSDRGERVGEVADEAPGVTERLRWRDAEAALARLSAADRRTLLLLARLPFLWAEPIRRLNGCNGPASDYRCLARLRGAGLIASLHVSFRSGHSPALHHLTDLGLAAVALDQQIDPEDLALRNMLRGADLLALLPGLTELIAFYELLAALAASRQTHRTCSPGNAPGAGASSRPPPRHRSWSGSAPMPRSPGRTRVPPSC